MAATAKKIAAHQPPLNPSFSTTRPQISTPEQTKPTFNFCFFYSPSWISHHFLLVLLANHTHRYYVISMPRSKQLSLVPRTWSKHHFAFGALLLKGSHPKKKRPFRAKLPMHLVMKSSKAKGRMSLLRFNSAIESIVEGLAARHHIKLLGAANGGNHLHLLIQASSRDALNAFVRGVAGRVAQLVNQPASAGSFWDARPFSRLVSPGRDLKNVSRYLGINSMESLLGMSREAARLMTRSIQRAIDSGWLKRTPELQAAGFV